MSADIGTLHSNRCAAPDTGAHTDRELGRANDTDRLGYARGTTR
ncbi:hypothetical protein Y013_25030 (plasmid) [Rhodococcus pyridinivorans SB3094]|uniref:Uncharacterized protein n=1 Tax=Rhodococcus pyridinivorans SB3094 TaxID=1435356 RepID=V9XLE2_9NOCA|nr:hypothetical protein Y013_25030 [Rhodococcus pyridinivorans SB3094]